MSVVPSPHVHLGRGFRSAEKEVKNKEAEQWGVDALKACPAQSGLHATPPWDTKPQEQKTWTACGAARPLSQAAAQHRNPLMFLWLLLTFKGRNNCSNYLYKITTMVTLLINDYEKMILSVIHLCKVHSAAIFGDVHFFSCSFSSKCIFKWLL